LQPPEEKGGEECLKRGNAPEDSSIYKVKERYGKLTDNAVVILAATIKEPQCPYRLMNIMFSDRFS